MSRVFRRQRYNTGVRHIYLFAAIFVAVMVMFNVPRLPWVEDMGPEGPVGVLRGLAHGVIGFSYMMTWFLIVAGIYQLILGVMYWDMDTTESERWQFALESGGTARLLWTTGAVTLLLGILYAWYVYSNDQFAGTAGIASTLGAVVACGLGWLAFPLMEQVGMDREELGV